MDYVTNNKMTQPTQTWMQRLLKVFKSEFIMELKNPMLIAMLVMGALTFIGPLAVGFEPDPKSKLPIEIQRKVGFTANIAQSIGQLTIYFLLFKLRTAFKDRTSLDKNRIMYLHYKKEQVLFAKLFSDFLMLLIPLMIYGVALTGVLLNKYSLPFEIANIKSPLIFICTILFLYLITTIGVRFILSKVVIKETKYILAGIWITFTVIGYMVLSILSVVVTNETNGQVHYTIIDFVNNNIYVCSFIPVLNILIPSIILTGLIPAWSVVPFIVESIIVLIIIFKPLSRSLKTYLTT